jgi:hypothetical protein
MRGFDSEQQREVKLMRTSLLAVSALAIGIALLAGCEPFSTDEGEIDQPAELSEYGGFTTRDEPPGFGDEGLVEGYPEDEDFDDDMENDPRVTNANRDRGAKQYALRIVWGNLRTRDSTVTPGEDCPVTDWSGSAEVDGGVLVVKRLIRFELGDHIVRPRRGPGKVQWVSHTKDHIDGLVFKILDVPDPASKEAKNTLRITTPFYNGEIALGDLEDYSEFVVYDDCNKISLVATRIKPLDCPRGFMEGGWVADSDTSGHFRGAWIGNEGSLMGYLRGRYEIRDGERVLYGKWITESGRFQGLLRGTWSPLRQQNGPDGIFEGRWVDETFTIKGSFRGHYHLGESDTSGFFQGRWIKHCP